MKRYLIPSGQFVVACPPGRNPENYVLAFTVTAYDPVMEQYIAVGHSVPSNLTGKAIYRASGRIPNLGEADMVVDVVPEKIGLVGIVTRREPTGATGPYYDRMGAAISTEKAEPGRAQLISTLLPDGSVEIEIISVRDNGSFLFTLEGHRCVSGMSGCPITQDGCIVGALRGDYGKQFEAIGVENMADGLFQAKKYKAREKTALAHKAAQRRRARAEVEADGN